MSFALLITEMREGTTIDLIEKRNLCPFLKEPFEDCYCVKMSSQDIERAVNYCVNRYYSCEIYIKNNGIDNRPH